MLSSPILGKNVLNQQFKFILVNSSQTSVGRLPINLGYSATGYENGTVLARSSVDNLFYAYDPIGINGLDVAVCILENQGEGVRAQDFPNNTSGLTGAVFPGSNTTMYLNLLVGWDSGAATDLQAKVFAGDDGTNYVTI